MALTPIIDCGRTRVPCVACEDVIPRGEGRLGVPCNDGRVPNAKYEYYHVECAIDRLPRLVRQVLVAERFDEGVIWDPRGLNVELQARIDALDASSAMPSRRVPLRPEPRVEELVRQLYDDPDDRELLAVLADVLGERGDPRGELIVLDLVLESGGDEDQRDHRGLLRERLRPRVGDPGNARANLEWGVGYIRRASVGAWSEWYGEGCKDLWRHPSLRLLRELAIGAGPERWLVSELPALRRLEIDAPAITMTLPPLPRLEHLVLRNTRIDPATIEILASRERKIARLDVSACRVRRELYGALGALCDQLIT
jgi:hypothetical protein